MPTLTELFRSAKPNSSEPVWFDSNSDPRDVVSLALALPAGVDIPVAQVLIAQAQETEKNPNANQNPCPEQLYAIDQAIVVPAGEGFISMFDDLPLPEAYVGLLCAEASIWSMPDLPDEEDNPARKAALRLLWDGLLGCSSPLAAAGLEMIQPWTPDASRLRLLRKQQATVDFLGEGASIRDDDPALWVALQRSTMQARFDLLASPDDFPPLEAAADGLLSVCARFGWMPPCEVMVWRILDAVVELAPDTPFFQLFWRLYIAHYDWISRMCARAAETGEDREGIVSLWEVANDFHGVPPLIDAPFAHR